MSTPLPPIDFAPLPPAVVLPPEEQLRLGIREFVTRAMDPEDGLGLHLSVVHDIIMIEINQVRDDIARVDREGRA